LKISISRLRFSALVFRFLFIGALAAGGSVAPLRLAAQQAAETTAASAGEKAKPSQEEQNNVFRLEGPIVKWGANTFHQSPETVATAFEFLNFGIIVFGIGIPLFRFLPKFLRARAEKVRGDIESARKATEEANARLKAVEDKLANLGDEIAKFRAEVEAESLQDEARIKGTIAEESARIVAAAEQELASAAAQARRGLRHFAADLAIEQAAKQLVLDPETDRALIAEFVSGAGLNGTAKGGKN
jgi:F-type H+-transporting ATPase subunit b